MWLKRARKLSIPLIVLAAAALLTTSSQAAAHPLTDYEGRWNYDLPDLSTNKNIATLDVGGTVLRVPQVGDIVLTSADDGGVIGRTDVGCTWRFARKSGALELDPPNQRCFNPTFRVSYTITRWTIAGTGRHASESLVAISHQPTGDRPFILENGARTKAPEHDPHATRDFTGRWRYESPEQGEIAITRDYGNRITAHEGGCTWGLVARGGTARLDPPAQSCTTPAGPIVLRLWTIASDSTRQVTSRVGTDAQGRDFSVSGALNRIR
ncbi:hypothetical protein EV193_105353 [Herbihabitans rhizosphaerae]|uniref:META domain-containing protein n=1 Tax=Herbihabitans rhizosphaerae TaxID=1872711 RepID=A0A4Q7KN53_9PSEU|nr:hypothetical protein [Herbihabitans rhizosphaerae]RZS37794.1 hypothetical protein EV193_105353 [Herbihabitans rhizosphaerae]